MVRSRLWGLQDSCGSSGPGGTHGPVGVTGLGSLTGLVGLTEREAMLLVSGGEKGGTGKTALATNLAVCLAMRGRDVLLVDADPQRSSAKWASQRAKLPVAGKFAKIAWCELNDDLYAALVDLRGRYSDVIVDVGGVDGVAFRTALAAADRLYSPMVPSDVDLETAGDLNQLVGQVRALGNRALQAFVVLNHCSTHPSNDEIGYAREALAEFPNLPLAAARLSHVKPWRDAYRARLGVAELSSSPIRKERMAAIKPSVELWNLYKEITGDQLIDAEAV